MRPAVRRMTTSPSAVPRPIATRPLPWLWKAAIPPPAMTKLEAIIAGHAGMSPGNEMAPPRAIASTGINANLARALILGFCTFPEALHDHCEPLATLPIADKALTGMALIGLSIIGELPWWVTIVILVREWGITIMRFAMLRYGVMAAGRGGKIKTVIQAVAIILAVVLLMIFGSGR